MADDEPDYERGPGRHPTPVDPRQEWQRLRNLALTVPCRDCRVPKDVACVNRDGGNEPALLKKAPAHASRINDARKAL